ncbi:PREDICTED: aminoacyl tRNA synthase complex-interacting multifunctional protein 1 [Nicotiana attenuata]|uniref:Methionine--trna ligase n=1 Tax=Nicotiana attenuata TaxID=49451 RepID=A0A1J6IJ58_NICAT|nr:PREDICTED: aminoacyl tRNA synthase complex-interacting multifunctional protein 1 [Nicotiana attenuata]OIS97766.1 putative methionine--trna ligase [Nicotiana attenuata]
MNAMGIGAANWLKGSGTLLLSCRTNSITAIASRSRPSYCSSSLLHHKNNNTIFSTNCHKIGHWNNHNTKLCFNFYYTAPSNVSATEKDSLLEEDEETKLRKIKDAANTLDIRVGRILKAWRHEEADSLYVEEVDVGEAEPRIICSGLVKYVPLDHLQERNVIVLANLKPRNMRGVKSNGMLMAASDASHENVELLEPPEGSVPGERIWFGSADEKENLPEVATPNQVAKKKIWELVQPHLKTDGACAATLGMHSMRTSTGVVVSGSLKDATIS